MKKKTQAFFPKLHRAALLTALVFLAACAAPMPRGETEKAAAALTRAKEREIAGQRSQIRDELLARQAKAPHAQGPSAPYWQSSRILPEAANRQLSPSPIQEPESFQDMDAPLSEPLLSSQTAPEVSQTPVRPEPVPPLPEVAVAPNPEAASAPPAYASTEHAAEERVPVVEEDALHAEVDAASATSGSATVPERELRLEILPEEPPTPSQTTVNAAQAPVQPEFAPLAPEVPASPEPETLDESTALASAKPTVEESPAASLEASVYAEIQALAQSSATAPAPEREISETPGEASAVLPKAAEELAQAPEPEPVPFASAPPASPEPETLDESTALASAEPTVEESPAASLEASVYAEIQALARPSASAPPVAQDALPENPVETPAAQMKAAREESEIAANALEIGEPTEVTPSQAPLSESVTAPSEVLPEQEMYDAALEKYFSRRYADAHASLLRFEELYPNSPLRANVRYWQGECLFALKRYAEADICFADVEKLSPSSHRLADALLMMVQCRLNLGQRAEAADTLKKLKEKYPNSRQLRIARNRMKESR